jgi:hypothetical protein
MKPPVCLCSASKPYNEPLGAYLRDSELQEQPSASVSKLSCLSHAPAWCTVPFGRLPLKVIHGR